MSDAPTVDHPDQRTTTVTRSADGLFYTFDIRYHASDEQMHLLAGLPTKQGRVGSLHAQFTLPAQIVAEMFAGVTEAAMTPADSEEAADRILAPAS